MKCFLLLAIPFALCAKVPQLAVMPLSPHGVDSSDAAVLTDALSDAFLRTGAVRILERQRMDAILKEQGFEGSGACDGSECAVKAGQLLGIDQIVVGSIGKLGSSYVLSLRRVDVGTGQILASSSRNQRGALDELLDGAVVEAVADLSGVQPKSTVQTQSSRTKPPPRPEPELPSVWNDRENMVVFASSIPMNTLLDSWDANTFNLGYSRILKFDSLPNSALLVGADIGYVSLKYPYTLEFDDNGTFERGLVLRLDAAWMMGYKRLYGYAGPVACIPFGFGHENGVSALYWQAQLGAGVKAFPWLDIGIRWDKSIGSVASRSFSYSIDENGTWSYSTRIGNVSHDALELTTSLRF